MRFVALNQDRLTTFCASCPLFFILLLLPAARAQDSAGESMTPRVDQPEIAVIVRDSSGATITSAGSVKLYRDGMLANVAGLSHGRAFFGSLSNGDYSIVVDAIGYKTGSKDLNVSISMRYEVELNLRLEGAADSSGAPAKPLLAPKAREALDRALKSLADGKLGDAGKHLDEAVKLAPGHPDVLYVQGVLYLDQQKWPQAQEVLEKASQLDPSNGLTLAALGMALTDEGKYDAAVAPLEKSLQLNNNSWEVRWALGKAYYHRQQYDQALQTSQLALTESNGKAPQIELLVAQSLTAVGKYDDAAGALRDFLKRYGDRPEAPTARRWLNGLASNGKIHSN